MTFPRFDFSKIKTNSIFHRKHKVVEKSLVFPDDVLEKQSSFKSPELDSVIEAVLEARLKDRAVMIFTGAHLIKNGFGPLLIRLMQLRLVTLVATNAAGFTHDLELAMLGETSEFVSESLPKGLFGVANETGLLMSQAFMAGMKKDIGAGEAIGRMINGDPMPNINNFPKKHLSVAAHGAALEMPVTMHCSIGTDVIDQHPSFNAAAKGYTSGIDFSIFAAHVRDRLSEGVMINMGSSVLGPEVFLKAVNMACNVGCPPLGLTGASFDIRPASEADVKNERAFSYYFRDHKSVVHRIPEAFEGKGYYVQGDHLQTIPALFKGLLTR